MKYCEYAPSPQKVRKIFLRIFANTKIWLAKKHTKTKKSANHVKDMEYFGDGRAPFRETGSPASSSSRPRGIGRARDRRRSQRRPVAGARPGEAGGGQGREITWADALFQGPLLTGRADELVRAGHAVRVVLPAANPAVGVPQGADDAPPEIDVIKLFLFVADSETNVS
jgi:hypothetical protein